MDLHFYVNIIIISYGYIFINKQYPNSISNIFLILIIYYIIMLKIVLYKIIKLNINVF